MKGNYYDGWHMATNTSSPQQEANFLEEDHDTGSDEEDNNEIVPESYRQDTGVYYGTPQDYNSQPESNRVGGVAGKVPRYGISRLSIHCPIGAHPPLSCCPPVAKDEASANQRPHCHRVWEYRGHSRWGLSQSEASPP